VSTTISRANRISIFDFNVVGSPRAVSAAVAKCRTETRRSRPPASDDLKDLRADLIQDSTGLWTAYAKGADWLFYGSRHTGHEPSPARETAIAATRGASAKSRLLWPLPRTDRFILPGQGVTATQLNRERQPQIVERGWSISLARDSGVGVAAVWFEIRWEGDDLGTLEDAEEFKRVGLIDFGQLKGRLAQWGLEVKQQERQHVVIAVRLASPGSPREVIEHGDPWLGRTFVGSLEYADERWLRCYTREEESLSHRTYERLYVRWTDTLALYGAGAYVESYEDEYYTALARSVQVVELCVLVRRLLRNIRDDISVNARDLRVLSPRAAFTALAHRRRLLQPFWDVEESFYVAPPFRTVEGERLVAGSFEKFGIDRLFVDVRRVHENLERRLEFVAAEWALIGAILAFTVTSVLQFVV
jgi:hypothetical protein